MQHCNCIRYNKESYRCELRFNYLFVSNYLVIILKKIYNIMLYLICYRYAFNIFYSFRHGVLYMRVILQNHVQHNVDYNL